MASDEKKPEELTSEGFPDTRAQRLYLGDQFPIHQRGVGDLTSDEGIARRTGNNREVYSQRITPLLDRIVAISKEAGLPFAFFAQIEPADERGACAMSISYNLPVDCCQGLQDALTALEGGFREQKERKEQKERQNGARDN